MVKQIAAEVCILLTAFAVMAVGILMIVNTDWGVDPWSAFHLGLATQTGLSLGRVIQVIGVLAVTITLALKGRTHVTWITLLNAVFIGFFIDLFDSFGIINHHAGVRGFFYLLSGVVIRSFGNAMYLAIKKGAGPRDGLMLVLTERTGWPLFAVRNGMDLTVLVMGALLGARIGIGTVIIAVLMGPCVHFFLHILSVLATVVKRQAVHTG